MGQQRNRFVLAFILFLVPIVLYSQEYLHIIYSTDDGLVSPTIHDIAQDIKGRMWFATPKGITCYDGTTWQNYSKGDGLSFKDYYKIRTDKQGNIWAFTKKLNEGISFFDNQLKQWRHIKGPGKKREIFITSIALIEDENQQGTRIGIGTLNNGFYIYYTNISPGSNEKYRWIHGGYFPIFRIDSYNHSFYLATDMGLFTVDPAHPDEWKQVPIHTPSFSIHSVAIEKKPYSPKEKKISPRIRIWLMGREWLGYYFYSQNHFHLLHQGELPGIKGDYYYDHLVTLPDGFGGFWVGNRISFLQVTPGPGDRVRILTPLGIGGGYSAIYDREFNLWVGTFRGAHKITDFCFENYASNNGLFDDEVSTVQEIGNGDMVLGHNGGFTFLIDNNIKTYEIPGLDRRALLDARVLDMCRDRGGNVWAAVSNIGVVKITLARPIKMMWYKNINPWSPQNYYSSVLVDNSGDLWAAVNDRLFKWQSRGFISPGPQVKVACHIRRLFKGKGKIIYIAGGACGLFLLQNGVIKQITDKSVFGVYADKKGNVLVGARKGLFALQGDKLIKFQHQQFHIDDPVYFITEDHEGELWFGLNNGVIRWDGTHYRHYTRQDGLVGRETNRAAGYVDSSGRVWIGTDSGVSCYYRDREQSKHIPPLLELVHLDASGIKYPLNRDNTLKHYQNDLTFYFRGISFINEKAMRYNLMLEGFDRKWVRGYQTPYNQYRYTNVPPGRYRFYVQAVNSLGKKTGILSSGIITIRRPFFQTVWFYFLLFFLLVVIIFLIGNFILKKRSASRLEEQVRQRTRALEASEKDFREIFENAHDAIIILDPVSENVYEVNQRACEIYGFSREEFIGMSMERISKDVKKGKVRIEETLSSGVNYHFETVQYRKDGSEMYLEINASMINYQEKLAILSINRDITQRKRAEQEIKKSLEEKEVLLTEIHHRVKNNLQIISSLLDLQFENLEELQNPQILKAFQHSKDRIRSMALIHENLYQSGDLARIDVTEYTHNLVDYFFSTYGRLAKNVISHIQIDSTLSSLSLTMDIAVPIGLILTELLSNALKHAFPNDRKGEVHIVFSSEIPGTLTLTVSDNGVGLPKEIDLKRIKSLGLELVTMLTQQVKGTVNIDRSSGTAVKITFPYPKHP
jgi:PAS domain S-box-containing protein